MDFQRVAVEPTHGREVFLASLDRLSEWPAPEESPVSWFTAFVALDADDIEDAELREFARRCVASRCLYVSTWGPGCERVHDTFDEVLVDAEMAGEELPFVVTTWHDNDSLDEALWFALTTATPSHIDATEARGAPVVAITTSPHTAAAIRDRARDLRRFYAKLDNAT